MICGNAAGRRRRQQVESKKSILFVMNTMGRAGAERALFELMGVLDPSKFRTSLYVLIPGESCLMKFRNMCIS